MVLGVVIWSIWEQRRECKDIQEEEAVVLINERIVKRASGRKEFWDFLIVDIMRKWKKIIVS